jgi:hypothetical protein
MARSFGATTLASERRVLTMSRLRLDINGQATIYRFWCVSIRDISGSLAFSEVQGTLHPKMHHEREGDNYGTDSDETYPPW